MKVVKNIRLQYDYCASLYYQRYSFFKRTIFRWQHQVLCLFFSAFILFFAKCNVPEINRQRSFWGPAVKDTVVFRTASIDSSSRMQALDTSLFNRLSLHLVHDKPNNKFPVNAAYPLPGALLPFKRIITYYGNFYSPGMGILGELSPQEIQRSLMEEVKNWQQADTLIQVQPAIEYIAVSAQRNPGKDNMYRLRMPASQIDKALDICKEMNAILFLDIQVGHCSLPEELPLLLPYLLRQDVHLAIDPEYSMKSGAVPCSEIGTYDASDINYASNYLAEIVRQHHLPPKILIVHRFTKGMVTHYKDIVTQPEVQIVMNMDGFGFPAKKIDTYKSCIAAEPVQFTGFKLFYKNDIQAPPYRLMKPAEIIALYPSPIYIQYQ